MNPEVACSCCGRDLLWRLDTDLVGYQRLCDDEPELELRNCACGSTLARPHLDGAHEVPTL